MRFTRAVVITLDETPERLAAFRSSWDALDTDMELDVHTSALDDRPVRGCWLAHQAVLSAAMWPMLVFEDDAVFGPSFTPDVDLAPDWDLVYLGGRYQREPGHGVHPVRHADLTHAYGVRDPQAVAAAVGAYVPGSGIGQQLGHHLPLRRYGVNPQAVGQRGGVTSTITGAHRDSDDYFLIGAPA